MLLGVLGIGALCFGPRYGILAHERTGQQAKGTNLSPAIESADDEIGLIAGETMLQSTAQSVTPLRADVRVRVLAQDGTPEGMVGVLARLESASGELLAETWARSAADGRLVFPAWGRFAREQALGTLLRIVFESEDPAELELRASSLPDREFTLVRTIDFDREFARAAAGPSGPVNETSMAAERLAESAPIDVQTQEASAGMIELEFSSQAKLGPGMELNDAELETAPATALGSPANVAAGEHPGDFSGGLDLEQASVERTPVDPNAPAELNGVVAPIQSSALSKVNTQRTEAPVRTLPLAAGLPQAPAPTKATPREVPSGALEGRLLLDVSAREVFVELDEVLPLDPQRAGRRLGPLVPDADGRFTFTDVQPGLCAVRVGLFGSRRTLMWVDNLDVPVGATLQTEALQAINLRGRLGSIAIVVFDHLGQRLESAVVAPLEQGRGLVGRLRVQAPGATARVSYDRQALNGPGSLDLRLEAPGFAPRDVLVTEAELTAGPGLAFALKPLSASPLELRLVGDVPEPSTLVAQLVRPDGQVRPWDFAEHRGAFDTAGRLRLTPVETGSFLVRVLRPVDGGWEPVGLDVPIELAPDDGERDIVFIPWTE